MQEWCPYDPRGVSTGSRSLDFYTTTKQTNAHGWGGTPYMYPLLILHPHTLTLSDPHNLAASQPHASHPTDPHSSHPHASHRWTTGDLNLAACNPINNGSKLESNLRIHAGPTLTNSNPNINPAQQMQNAKDHPHSHELTIGNADLCGIQGSSWELLRLKYH